MPSLPLLFSRRTLVALALFLGLWFFSGVPLHAAPPMPSFTLSSATDGEKVSSNAFRGQVVLINFFATWCPPCREEIPALVSLQKELGPKGFSVLGISVDQGSTQIVQKFLKKMEVNYPVAMGNSRVTRDFGGVIGIPASFLVDRQGMIVKSYPGFVDHGSLARDIKSLL